MNELWDQLCTIDVLRRGWHLTREDMKRDYSDDVFAKEAFGYFDDTSIAELLKVLRTGQFRPKRLTRVAIPKGTMATRPGTVLSLEDRVVLFGALSLIAKQIDSQLSDGVYSYRVRDKPSKKTLFNEGDLLSYPFLKGTTVRRYIDPFDPWYQLWVEFDEVSKRAFQDDGYRFMVTSDISAYYENIQLDILRDQLQRLLPEEPKLTNLFINAFASWTYDNEQGRRYMRGIPQGTQISSLFGNIFLKPIDDAFVEFGCKHDIKYFRYMDDVRIFTKTLGAARGAVFLLDKTVRSIHLNLQSAKTKIYDERNKEVTLHLFDRRLGQLGDVDDQIARIKSESRASGVKPDYSPAKAQLQKIAKTKPEGGAQIITGAKKPLSGLSDRVFRMLVSKHIHIGDTSIIKRLVAEMERNPDSRLGQKLIRCAQKFPRSKAYQATLLKYLKSPNNIFPYQEAQILNAFRYHSRIDDDVCSYVLSRARDENCDEQIRVHAFRLLARLDYTAARCDVARKVFFSSESVAVRKAASLTLIRQRGEPNSKFVREIVFHPDEELRKLGKLYRAAKNNEIIAKNIITQAFSIPHLLVDYIPLLFLMAESKNQSIIGLLENQIRKSEVIALHNVMDMRDRCRELRQYCDQNQSATA